jgi:hypothetical protein
MEIETKMFRTVSTFSLSFPIALISHPIIVVSILVIWLFWCIAEMSGAGIVPESRDRLPGAFR